MDRWSLVEYGIPVNIIKPIADSIGLSEPEICTMLLNAGTRISKVLGFSSNPIVIEGESVRAVDIAGLIRVAPGIELEIAPKFLGLDSINNRWREDFFFLATLSKHGRLLNTDRLRSSSGERGDLHTLVAQSVTDMYWSNHRRPLRNYIRRSFTDFAFDGDVEVETILNPGHDGYEQTSVLYDRHNSYNAVILAAARELLPNLRDPSTIIRLERMIHALSPQSAPINVWRNKRLPNRSLRWQPLYDLSVDILKGFGVKLISGTAIAPGYVLETWRVWQDLIGLALKLGFGSHRVLPQAQTTLGTRRQMRSGGGSSRITVKPDYIILDSSSTLKSFLIDAKYKCNNSSGQMGISETDLYEALAFANATGCKTILLAYPAPPSDDFELGQANPFEQIVVNQVNVIGVEIETKNISSTGGLMKFAQRCCKDFQMIVDSMV